MKMWLLRRWWDFRRGDSLYLRLPFSALSYVTVIYTLLLERIPFFKALFPHFLYFVVVSLVLYPLVGCVVGWLDRRYHVLSTDLEIMGKENPPLMEVLERVKRIEKMLEAQK